MDTQSTILLVEDDPFLREAIRLLLEDAGYGVREAGTAAQALAVLDDSRPSLVLLDLGLPDRSGVDLVHDLNARTGRSDGTDIPIVALTGRAGADERRRCMAAGCRDYLVKPVDPRTLLQKIPELLLNETDRD